jgi:hypothetical protein
VFEKPDWDFRSLNFDVDVQLATAKTGQHWMRPTPTWIDSRRRAEN